MSVWYLSYLNHMDLIILITLMLLMNCVEFCMNEVFKCRERRMMQQDEEWTKAQAWDVPWTPQEISKRYKRQSLGMPDAPPLHQQKAPGHFSIHYIFIASCIMCYSWSVFVFVFSLFCFVCCNKLGCILAFLCGRETHSVLIA